MRIPLRNRKGHVVAYAEIDPADAFTVAFDRWYRDVVGYPARSHDRQRMHRVLTGLGVGDPRQADHRDGDKLNNRRSNLRVVPGQAAQNQNRVTLAASGYRGVYLYKPTGRWYGQVKHDGKRYLAGHHDTPEQAHEAVALLRASVLPYAVERD